MAARPGSRILIRRSDPEVSGRPRFMWILAMYDLPTNTQETRRAYARFHKKVEALGYERLQFSVYRRFVGTADRVDREAGRLIKACPKKGRLSILSITEKQMGRIITVINGAEHNEKPRPTQFVLL